MILDHTHKHLYLRKTLQYSDLWGQTYSLEFQPREKVKNNTKKHQITRTPCAPERLMMGASKLLVRFTVRISACCRSSLEEDIAI